MSLEMIIGLIILLVVAAVVIKIFMDKMSNTDIAGTEDLDVSGLEQSCTNLCQQYVSTMAPADALKYCERYYAIDLNKDGKTLGQAGEFKGFGVCEDRVYCFNIQECSWGASTNSRLTAEKCRAIMCDVYTERQGDSSDIATEIIRSKMDFGGCGLDNPEIQIDGTDYYQSQWFVESFGKVNCTDRDYENDLPYDDLY